MTPCLLSACPFCAGPASLYVNPTVDPPSGMPSGWSVIVQCRSGHTTGRRYNYTPTEAGRDALIASTMNEWNIRPFMVPAPVESLPILT